MHWMSLGYSVPALGSLEEGKRKSLSRKVVSIVLISLTGGVAMSALDDLFI